jgi:hypothetical protein
MNFIAGTKLYTKRPYEPNYSVGDFNPGFTNGHSGLTNFETHEAFVPPQPHDRLARFVAGFICGLRTKTGVCRARPGRQPAHEF